MISVYLAELIGTMLLILLGGGVIASTLLKKSKGENAGWVVIVFAWGLAVIFAIYAVGQFSGAHINPAVTLGLASIGEFPWGLVPGYLIAQILGAMIGALLVWIHYLPHWKVSDDKEAKLAIFCTSPAINAPLSNLISEIMGTMVLVFGLMFIGANEFTDGLNPLVVGGLIMIIGFGLGGTTGFAINPARDLGPRLMHFILPISGKGTSGWSYAWIPIVGPIIGGVFGAQLHQALFNNKYSIIFWVLLIVIVSVMVTASIREVNKNKTNQQ